MHPEPLNPVHTDVCGSIEMESIGGARDSTSIDDYSNCVTNYPMKNKSDAMAWHLDFEKIVECQARRFTLVGRIDRRVDYFSADVEEHFCTRGIDTQLTTANYLHQNWGI